MCTISSGISIIFNISIITTSSLDVGLWSTIGFDKYSALPMDSTLLSDPALLSASPPLLDLYDFSTSAFEEQYRRIAAVHNSNLGHWEHVLSKRRLNDFLIADRMISEFIRQCPCTGKTCIGKLSEFIGILMPNCWTTFCDRFRVVFGANSTNSTVFVAIHTKFKILICPISLISYINTVKSTLIIITND